MIMTSAQVVEMSVNVTSNSPSKNLGAQTIFTIIYKKSPKSFGHL